MSFTSMPHSRTWPATFFASGQSSGVPSALAGCASVWLAGREGRLGWRLVSQKAHFPEPRVSSDVNVWRPEIGLSARGGVRNSRGCAARKPVRGETGAITRPLLRSADGVCSLLLLLLLLSAGGWVFIHEGSRELRAPGPARERRRLRPRGRGRLTCHDAADKSRRRRRALESGGGRELDAQPVTRATLARAGLGERSKLGAHRGGNLHHHECAGHEAQLPPHISRSPAALGGRDTGATACGRAGGRAAGTQHLLRVPAQGSV